jgi:hypothetical protein
MTTPIPSPENLAQLNAARVSAGKIRRVSYLAKMDGWGIAAFAAISFPFCFTSPAGWFICLGMAYVAWRELSLVTALNRLDVQTPKQLARNQLVFCGIIIVYCLWSLLSSLLSSQDSALIASASDALGMTAADVNQLGRVISIGIYSALIVLSILYQGGMAWYYYSRTKVLEDYLATTPQWIIDYQRGGGTL